MATRRSHALAENTEVTWTWSRRFGAFTHPLLLTWWHKEHFCMKLRQSVGSHLWCVQLKTKAQQSGVTEHKRLVHFLFLITVCSLLFIFIDFKGHTWWWQKINIASNIAGLFKTCASVQPQWMQESAPNWSPDYSTLLFNAMRIIVFSNQDLKTKWRKWLWKPDTDNRVIIKSLYLMTGSSWVPNPPWSKVLCSRAVWFNYGV